MRHMRHLVIFSLGFLLAACAGTTASDPADPADVDLQEDVSTDISIGDEVKAPDGGPQPEVSEPDAEVSEPDAEVSEPDAEVSEPDVVEEDTGPPEPVDCDPVLELSADSLYELPFGLVPLKASGGTGAYVFSLVESGSGALVNELTGAYLAGGTVDSQDVIEVTDAGCIGSAQITIEVVAPMTVEPESAEVGPGTSYQMALVHGSGVFSCSLFLAGSGGTVTEAGLYTAGDASGTDVISCIDEETGEALQAIYTVDTQAVLAATPPHITVSMGSTFVPRLSGGSGHFSLTVDGEAAAWEEEVLVALDPGQAAVTVTDDYTNQVTTIDLDVVAPFEVETVRAGDASYQATVLTPGDIDGDGWADAILAIHEVDVVSLDAGAIYVYAGKEGGMEPNQAPAQILAGQARRDRLGRHAAVGDLDQDGQLDLVVGASQNDGGATDNGALMIYRGIEGGFFETEPHQVLVGLFGFDQLGFGTATCDVNGDGWLDLVGAARYAEDRDLEVQPTNQGALYVFLGTQSGFPLKADQVLYGKVPVDGGWVDEGNLRMGYRMTSGDFDGDGNCDVAVSSYDYSSAQGRSNDGAVFLYQGQPKTDTAIGGLSPTPVRAWAGFEGAATSNLGRELAMGDLDGDGKDELLIAQYKEEAPGVSGSNHGALRVFKGEELTAGTAEFLAPSGADLSIFADQGGDGVGWAAAVGDVNGDEIGDLLVTSLSDEVSGGPSNTGTVAVHLGQAGALPSETPQRVIGGLVGGDTFGLAVGVLGDVDGDGSAELFAYAGRDNTLGIDVGLPYMVRSLPDAPAEGEEGESPEEGGEGEEEPLAELVPLDLPASASGSQVARGVAVLQDLNGDGLAEVAVGSPYVDNVEDNHLNRGQVTIYAGASGALSTQPLYVLEAHTGHSNSDFVGYAVADAGDFDGDGNPDVAVLARGEDRPGNFNNAAYAPDIPCTGSVSNTGAVFIYRSDGTALLDEQPAFIWYGSQKGQNMERMAAGMDINGDGKDDFVAGSDDWDREGAGNAGGFSVVFGLWHWNDPKIDVICDSDFTYVGLLSSDRVASDIAGIGDVNGDGCDDFAVGANAEDIGGGSRGSVRVFFGWGGDGCPAEPSYVYLSGMLNNAQAGISVDGGLDMDGDQIPDMVVGGHNLTVNGNRVGAAWFVSGAYLASLPAEPVVDGAAPAQVYPFIPEEVTSGIWMLSGEVDDEEFGRSVAMVPNVFGPGIAGMAVGGPLGNQGGTLRSGGVGVYGLNADPASDHYGLVPIPVSVFGGETQRAGGLLGRMVDGGLMGDQPVVMVGGYEASGLGLDQGAAYLMKLPAP